MEKLLDYFTPDEYDLSLQINRHHEIMSGKVEIRGYVHAETIKFHAVGMQIRSVHYLNMVGTPYYEEKGLACTYDYDGETISIPITAKMVPAFYRTDRVNDLPASKYDFGITFIIEFEAKLDHNMEGCYLSTYMHNGEEKCLVATQFESHYARQAFPCIDEPAAKATFHLKIELEDAHSEDVVLSNMPCHNIYGNTYAFARTPVMSTYLLAWVAGPLQSVSTINKNGTKVSSYCALNQPLESLLFANQTAARALEYYDEKFGIKYPLSKLDQVALPDFESGAMENWGLVTYRESMMLTTSSASLSTKRTVATTITHELAHQWFGDLVTMAWWDDLWLNESFASVIEYYAADAIYPELNVWQDFFTGDCLAALRRDCLPGVQAVQQAVHHPSEIATLFDGAIVYAKGARLILMLIRLMGEAKFRQGVRYYFDKFQYQNTTADDLWNALQLYANFDIKNFMHTWITQPGYPVLARKDVPSAPLEESQSPLIGIGADFNEHRFLITGDSDDTKWPLPEIFDDMSGHYLINLSDQEFNQKLVKFDEQSLEQKLRVLIDRMLLAKTPDVPSSSLLDLLPHFIHETSPAVWDIIIDIINDLKLFCPPETEFAASYKTYLQKLLKDQFENLDFGKLTDTDRTHVRKLLAGVAYYIEEPTILKQLEGLYQDNLSLLNPELRIYIIGAKLLIDENLIFDQLLKKYSETSDPDLKSDLLFIIASFPREAGNLKQTLALLDQPDIVRPQDHIFLYIYLIRNYRARAQTLNWLINHWNYVKTLSGEKSLDDYIRYTSGALRTDEEAKIFYDFIDPQATDPALTRGIKIAHTDIDVRLRLIKHDTPAVEAKLKELTKGE